MGTAYSCSCFAACWLLCLSCVLCVFVEAKWGVGVLYRLRQAHKCSQQCSKPAYARPNDIEAGGGEVAVQDDDAAKQIHGIFMQMALQLVDGRLDSSQYEDSCRQLLGASPSSKCSVHKKQSLDLTLTPIVLNVKATHTLLGRNLVFSSINTPILALLSTDRYSSE